MRRTATLTAIATVLVSAAMGQSISEPSGVTISVTGAGAFTISSGHPAWTYAGSIPGHVTYIAGPESGSDNNAVSTNGLFDQLTVNYSDPEGNPWSMQVRAYRSSPSASISFSPLTTVPNQRPYAVLHQFPITPHHFSNAGWNRAFGLVGWMDTDSPWVFFDDQFNTSILSAAARPISERQVWVNDGSANGLVALEIDASNPQLPAGDVYSHLITFGQGIGKTFSTWGWTLRNIFARPLTGNQSDLSLILPMLSTDSGATYYYNFDPSLGYEGTLRAAIHSAQAAGIPIGVTHFDSWWYLKGGNCSASGDPSFASWKDGSGGVWKYVTDPSLFPPINANNWEDGFVQSLGPGMAHGRWVDTCSPYRLPILDATGNVLAANPVSGNVVIDSGIWARIAQALKQSGMVIFEQDWLSTSARAANTFDDEKFLNAMESAMAGQEIDLQFCMPLARHLLEAIRNEHVHTVRVSGDRFGWSHWDAEMYGSIVLNAGSVWPAVDNFQTTEERNLLLAVLSAGPLALSDPIGAFVPISQAIRSDGLILKPDESMVPTDASFVAEATAMEQYYGVNGPTASNAGNQAPLILPPLVAQTYSDFGPGVAGTNKVEYVFAFSRNLNAPAQVSFAPQDFGFAGAVYVYNYFGKTGWRQPAAQAIVQSVDSQGSYFVIASVGPSGIAFLGDLSRFVPASRERVLSLADNGQITAALQFVPGETVPVSISAASAPIISADGATVSAPVLDSTTGLYQVLVASGQNKQATIRIVAPPG
jgi:hypothetical protein